MSSDPLPPCTCLELSGELDIYGVGPLKDSLLEALQAHDFLQIDLSSVEGIDGAGLQVLALVHRESVRTGKLMRLVGCSTNLIAQFRILGMQHFFGEALVSAAGADQWEIAA